MFLQILEYIKEFLHYQNRLLDHLLNNKVLTRMTNSSLYGNEYELPYYMIDLRKSIFETDLNSNISTVRQNFKQLM